MPCHRGGISPNYCFCPLSTKIFGGKKAAESGYTWPFRCDLLKAGPDQDFVSLSVEIHMDEWYSDTGSFQPATPRRAWAHSHHRRRWPTCAPTSVHGRSTGAIWAGCVSLWIGCNCTFPSGVLSWLWNWNIFMQCSLESPLLRTHWSSSLSFYLYNACNMRMSTHAVC